MKPEKHSAVLNIRLPLAEKEEVTRLAAERNQTASEFARQALSAVLRALRTQSKEIT